MIIYSECTYADWPSRKAEPRSWNTVVDHCDRELIGPCTGVGQLEVQTTGEQGEAAMETYFREGTVDKEIVGLLPITEIQHA